MTDSQKLLVEYARNGSESAFRELVSRYINFVYSTALRLVDGDTHLAEDVAQMVFINLANRSRSLSTQVMLGGWLHQHTYHVATKVVRAQRRRQSREREAMEMNTLHNDDSAADLRQVAPILDEAITQLGAEDRSAILLRFFEQRDFRSVGEALGSNEDAARMRVKRALEKLHFLLKRRGVTLSVAALGTALAAETATAAPAGLAVTVASGALAGAAGTGTTLTFLKLMTMTKLKFSIAALVIAGATTAFMIQHQAQIKLGEENQSLRQQIARLQSDNANLVKREAMAPFKLHLPAPPIQAAAQTNASPTEELQATNLYARFNDKAPKLTPEQVAAYLKANGRKASTLLAAYRTSSDPALLREAMEKYPNDPQVAFEAAISTRLSPEDRRPWLNAFEQTAPNNVLANYLSARDYFKSGQTDQAVQELTAASGKTQLQDYTLNRMQDDEEAYLSAGYSVAEAETIASRSLEMPYLADVKQLGRDTIALANTYGQSGDQASAQAALQLALNMGQTLQNAPSSSSTLISQLVGMSIERLALGAMDPGSPYGQDGRTVQDQLDQLAQNRAAIQNLSQQAQSFMPGMTDQDWVTYTNRRLIFGELAALQWIVSKYGQQ